SVPAQPLAAAYAGQLGCRFRRSQVQMIVEYRSRVAARICRESVLTWRSRHSLPARRKQSEASTCTPAMWRTLPIAGEGGGEWLIAVIIVVFFGRLCFIWQCVLLALLQYCLPIWRMAYVHNRATARQGRNWQNHNRNQPCRRAGRGRLYGAGGR